MDGGGKADEKHSTAKISVWWDVNTCPVPAGSDPHAIVQTISSALVRKNYCGPVSITAYGDTGRIPARVQRVFCYTGISLNHVGVEDRSETRLLADMLLWAVDNPAPANFFLISGNEGFPAHALYHLWMRRYTIRCCTLLVAGPPPSSNGESQPGNSSLSSFPQETLYIPFREVDSESIEL